MKGTASVRFGFDPEPSAPGQARRAVSELLDEWDLAALAPVVELLVSEVVTNAVRHARSAGELEISLDGGTLRVAVSDETGGTPGLQNPRPDQPTGRGLAIVDTVASRWGVGQREHAGKTVWFELDLADLQLEV